MSLLLLEQVQVSPPLQLDRHAQLRLLQSVPAPPAACEAFFVVAARSREAAEGAAPPLSAISHHFGLYRHNVDAMLLASYHNRPTINGFSSFNPTDWDFANPWKPDYLDRVRTYARRHDIKPLCGFDYRRSADWFLLEP